MADFYKSAIVIRGDFMGDIYSNNIKAFMEHNPNSDLVLSYINEISGVEDNVFEEENNVSILYQTKKYRLLSENRLYEAEQMIKGLDFNKDNLIILFGLANTECIRMLRKDINEGTRVVIFEPNKYVLKHVLFTEDLTDIFETDQFILIIGEDDLIDQTIKYHFTKNLSNLVHNISIISLPNYYLYNDFRKTIIKNIKNTIDIYIKSLGNSLQDIFEGLRNNYQNVDAFMTANSIDEISGKYSGYPAFVIASGPSLDSNIHHLHKAMDKALIITCDASYNACKKNNVKPDAIASIERVEATYKFYYKDKTFDEDLVLVGPGVMWPNILEEYKGKKILMAKATSGQENWWTRQFDNNKFVNMGFSCANVAFSVAKRAGCNPIILVGQDLAYTNEKIHSDSTHTKFEGKNEANQKSTIWVEDVHGGQVRTNYIYNLFREWFEYQIAFDTKTVVIDATEGGARIQGTIIMKLEEAIEKYCTKNLDKHMNDYLEDIKIDLQYKKLKYKQILDNSEKQINSLKKIQRKASKHYKTLISYKNLKFENLAEKELVDIVLKMQKGDKIIKYIIEDENDVADCYQQIIKQTIIYVKKIGNSLTASNVRRNLQLQVNLMYMIKDSTDLIINEYKKLKEFIEKKALELDQEMVGVLNE